MNAATPEAELRQVLHDLLFAVATIDLAALQALFCNDATMHFPMGPPHGLIVGRPAIVARFERLFGELRARLPGPPYARFKIEEFAFLPLDARHAALYATLTVDGRIGRRTLLMRRDPDVFRILHLHASNAAAPRGGESA